MRKDTRILAIVVVAAGWIGSLTGCTAPNPFQGREFEAVRSAPELPYFVKVRPVKLAVDVRQGSSTGVPTPELARPETASHLAEAIRESLDQHNVFSGVSTDATGSSGASGSSGLAADYELSVIVKGQLQEVPRAESTSAAWYSTLLWFVMVVPGWFPEDVRVNQDIDVVYALYPAGQNTSVSTLPAVAGEVELDEAERLNFYRRSAGTDFLLQLLVPPVWVPPDPESTHHALYENYRSHLQSEIARSLKMLVPRMQIREGLPELFVFPEDGAFSALVLSDEPPREIKVERVDADGTSRPVCRLNGRDLRSMNDDSKADWIDILRDLGLGEMSERALEYDHKYVVRKSASEVENLDGASGDSFLKFEVVFKTRSITRTVGF